MPASLHPPMRRFLRPFPEHGHVLWNLCSATQSPAQKGLTHIKVFHSCYQNCQRRSLLPESFFYNFSRYLFEFFFVAFSVSVIFSVYFEPFGRTNAIFSYSRCISRVLPPFPPRCGWSGGVASSTPTAWQPSRRISISRCSGHWGGWGPPPHRLVRSAHPVPTSRPTPRPLPHP